MFGHLGLVFIWSSFVSCLLLLSYYVICAPVLTEGTEKQSKRRETNHNTVEPRYNEPLYNDVLGITNAIFGHSNGEIHEKEPR